MKHLCHPTIIILKYIIPADTSLFLCTKTEFCNKKERKTFSGSIYQPLSALLFFHINLEKAKKWAWVQSDTAKLEQPQKIFCQVNDRMVERKSTCPHFHLG